MTKKADSHFTDTIKQAPGNLTQPTKGIKLTGLVSSAFEHGLTALVFLAGGYWIMTTFEESFIGFLGVAMMLWGGLFKGTILLATYGFALFALTFRRDWFAHVVEQNQIRKIEERMARDIKDGHRLRAEDRLHGLLCTYPGNMRLRSGLAGLLLERDELYRAGRLVALHPAPSSRELEAIDVFCKGNGHDPFQIMRKAIKGLRGQDLSQASRVKLLGMHRAITRESDMESWQWRNVGRYLENTLLRPWWHKFLKEYRNTLIELVFAITVVASLWAIK